MLSKESENIVMLVNFPGTQEPPRIGSVLIERPALFLVLPSRLLMHSS